MPLRSAVPVVRLLSVCLLMLTLAGCAAFFKHDPLNVQVAGIQPLPGEGLELRMAVKLRVQNPNDRPLDYDGIALELEIHGSHGIQAFRYDAALALIESGRLQPEKMIGSRITLAQSIDVLTAMDASTATGIPVITSF